MTLTIGHKVFMLVKCFQFLIIFASGFFYSHIHGSQSTLHMGICLATTALLMISYVLICGLIAGFFRLPNLTIVLDVKDK